MHGNGLADAHQVINLTGTNADFNLTRVFAYGKPGALFIQGTLDEMYLDWDGFCLVSDLVGHDILPGDLQVNPPLVHPHRRNGQPGSPASTPLAHRLALPIPSSGVDERRACFWM
ncbi:MAG: hypothetical protein EBT45_07065 [Alphaproteobacteria bacterium]|nr:hypothetical protein [Alphaproteobacteria bacterium]